MFDLKGYVDFALEHARGDLSRGRKVMTLATVIDSEGEMILIGAQNIQSEKDRDGWAALIRQKIAECRGQAVVITAGVNRANYTKDGEKKFNELQEAGILLNVTESAALGLCKKVESIMVALHTPLETTVSLQDYERTAGGKVEFGPVETVDDNMPGGILGGRFTGFFEKSKAAHPS